MSLVKELLMCRRFRTFLALDHSSWLLTAPIRYSRIVWRQHCNRCHRMDKKQRGWESDGPGLLDRSSLLYGRRRLHRLQYLVLHQGARWAHRSQGLDHPIEWLHRTSRRTLGEEPSCWMSLRKESARHYRLPFKTTLFRFRRRTKLWDRFVGSFGISIAGLFRFRLLFVLIPSLDLRERLIRILEGLGGQAGCHMYWALGSRRSLFGWFVLCSVGASRRCYLGMSDSHLLLSWAGSGCCDTTPDIGQTQLDSDASHELRSCLPSVAARQCAFASCGEAASEIARNGSYPWRSVWLHPVCGWKGHTSNRMIPVSYICRGSWQPIRLSFNRTSPSIYLTHPQILTEIPPPQYFTTHGTRFASLRVVFYSWLMTDEWMDGRRKFVHLFIACQRNCPKIGHLTGGNTIQFPAVQSKVLRFCWFAEVINLTTEQK